MKRALLLLIMISCFAVAKGQEITVDAAPDTTTVLIGDQIHFIVKALVPGEKDVKLSSVQDTLGGKIIVLGPAVRDSSLLPDGRIRIKDDYLITSFEEGEYTIPPFYAEVPSGDSIIRYYSDFSYLTVLRPDIAPSDSTDVIFDVVPPRAAPLTIREVTPWILIVLIMAVIIWALARYLPRNPLKRFTKPAPPPEPAHVIALRELEKLSGEQLYQNNLVKEYYSRLSDILRRYIDGRYGIMSPELTTDETVRMLQKASVLSSQEMSLIKEMLSLSDMVKFARYKPDETIHEKSMTEAVKFVEITRIPDLQPETHTDDKEKGGKDA